MDADTLLTASKYVNNLLVTRGLLRNGKEIRLEKPDRDTRAHTINLIHDLVLRRDKDHELREQSAITILALRNELSRRDVEIKKLKDERAAMDHSICRAQTQTSNAFAETRRIETSNKKLQEQLHKLKATMLHVKSQCAADVKKRDIQMERLRSHLQGQQRGNRSQVIAPSMSLSGGTGVAPPSSRPLNASMRDLDDPEYSLKQESNDFLTRLSAGLSDENDSLIHLVQSSLDDLKQLLSLDEGAHRQQHDQATTSVNDLNGERVLSDTEHLAKEMEVVRSTLRNLLTSPSFVAVEEVESRDEEIARLRDGWDQMELRWQDVLGMMDGWKRKMEKCGQTVDLDDLRKGLGLGVGLEMISKNLSPERRRRPSDSSLSGELPGRGLDERALSKDSATSGMVLPDRVPIAPGTSSRTSSASKSMTRSARSSRRGGTAPTPTPSDFGHRRQQPLTTKFSSLRMKTQDKENLPSSPQKMLEDMDLDSSVAITEPDIPQLSILEKLDWAQKEANEATRRSTPRTASMADVDVNGDESKSEGLFDNADDSLVLLRSSKKIGLKGRAKRRKSTLSPQELGSLLGLE